MGKSSKPRAPDPAATAAAQAQANKEAVRESARVNQIGINSPWGRQFYTGDIGAPDRALNIELSPAGQESLGYQEALSNLIGRFGAQELGPSITDRLRGDVSGVEDALYERGMTRIGERYDQPQDLLASRLISQGIPVGSRAYDQATTQLARERGREERDLALSAQLGALGEDRAQRSQAINELSALLQGAPAMGMPVTQMPAQYSVGAPDISGLTMANYAGELNQYNTQAQALGGLFALGGSFLGNPGLFGA